LTCLARHDTIGSGQGIPPAAPPEGGAGMREIILVVIAIVDFTLRLYDRWRQRRNAKKEDKPP
jgi:hypothetical protein